MIEPFSVITQELLDRAQRAIDRSIALRQLCGDQLAYAKQRMVELEKMMRDQLNNHK
ncbi:hypothetical protein Bra1253DRAFT_00781 [Bradyrhizobium sp. WSM1253]|nr:hypothetical protein Bra1253DRAFT_00781 [Bradyrhizobium sp. WSM1253]